MRSRIKLSKRSIALLGLFLCCLLLAGCMPGDSKYTEEQPAGFLSGIWHGWIAPISLIVGLFRDGVRVYEVVNTGWWYDFGFYIAIISGFGGISLFRK
jgi:hypothetical protein